MPWFLTKNETIKMFPAGIILNTPEWHQWHYFGVFIVTIEHISTHFSTVYVVDFERVNGSYFAFTAALISKFFVEIKKLEKIVM